MNGFHDLFGCVARLGNFSGRDSPDLRYVPARFRVVDGALARKLVAFLPVLAAALSVALTGDHHAAGAFAAYVARGQSEIDQCQAVFHDFRVMLNATRV